MSDASPSPSPSEPPPSKRRMLMVLAAVVVVALAVWSWRGHGRNSASIDASINLVTSDRDDLACASEQTFGRYRCEFRAPGVPWPTPPSPAERLAGYYTVDQQLYVIPGLFEQPALAARYAAEEPRKLARDQRPRFAAACQLKVIGHMHDFQTRWVKNGDSNHQDDAPVAIPSECRIP